MHIPNPAIYCQHHSGNAIMKLWNSLVPWVLSKKNCEMSKIAGL